MRTVKTDQIDLLVRLISVFMMNSHIIGSQVAAQIVLITSLVDRSINSVAGIGGKIKWKTIQSFVDDMK